MTRFLLRWLLLRAAWMIFAPVRCCPGGCGGLLGDRLAGPARSTGLVSPARKPRLMTTSDKIRKKILDLLIAADANDPDVVAREIMAVIEPHLRPVDKR